MSEYQPEHAAPETQKFWLSEKWYNVLKWITQIVLPALATFYLTIGALWNLAEPEKVAATIVAVDTFLGVVLMLATNSYNNSEARFDGQLNVFDSPEKKTFVLDVGDVDQLEHKKEFIMKVNNQPDVQ